MKIKTEILMQKRVSDSNFFPFNKRPLSVPILLYISCLNETFKSCYLDTTNVFNLLLSTKFCVELEI